MRFDYGVLGSCISFFLLYLSASFTCSKMMKGKHGETCSSFTAINHPLANLNLGRCKDRPGPGHTSLDTNLYFVYKLSTYLTYLTIVVGTSLEICGRTGRRTGRLLQCNGHNCSNTYLPACYYLSQKKPTHHADHSNTSS